MVLVYAMVLLAMLLAFAFLVVDIGRVVLVKTQAQNAADAAALYAADGLVGGTAASVRARAANSVHENQVNNLSITINTASDVEFGISDPTTRAFNVLSSGSEMQATAIRVTVRCTAARGTQISMFFGSIFGQTEKDVTVSAIASISAVTESTVPGLACPWLAGMPMGSTVANVGGNPYPANVSQNSPTVFEAAASTNFHFQGVSGNTSWFSTSGDGTISSANSDGDSTFIANQAPANGINTTYAPLNAMMGIFLDDNAPSTTAMAASLDFSSAASRNYSTLSPKLKQVFFIGDGLDANGVLQTVVSPPGATRLFIGTMDMCGWWWDNTGALSLTVVQGNRSSLVK